MSEKLGDKKSLEKEVTDEFIKILVPEIEVSLRQHKVPVTFDTKRAFLVGAKVSQMLSVELFNQKLMDLGCDPNLDPILKRNRKTGV